MLKYYVMVAGTVLSVCKTKEDAKVKLYEYSHSYLRMCHPLETFYIKVKER